MDSIRFDSMSLSMFLLLVLVVGLIVFILLIEPRLSKKKIKNNNEHGSSKFADMKEIKDNFNKEDLNDINKAGFPVWYEKENGKFKNVYYDNKSPHYVLIGSTGSGKSITVSIPICIQFATAKEKHSVVITDPKAELFKTTGKIFENNGYEIEPKITTRKSNTGYRISESVNLNLKPNEIGLVDSIKTLTDEEQMQIVQERGLSNVRDIMTSNFAKMQTMEAMEKEDYFASAIVDTYDWDKINVEELSITERNELIQKLKQSNCVSIYEKLKEAGIENIDIPTAVINIASKGNLKGILESENYIEQIQNNIEEIKQGLSIEQVERYLGYYDVKGTGISLRDYQQDAVDKAEEIYKEKRYASIILPTGGGKTYVALTEMLQYGKTAEEIAIEENQIELGKIAYKTNNKKMLYLAQTKDRIIENIHGKIGTSGKSKDKIIADVFKNLQFATYQSLITKAGKETLKKQYDFIIFDELHRTGAEKWEEALNKLLENQLETTKVLGITATPRRDADDRNMADEIAEKLGYTYEERQENKHIAAKIELKEAIQLGMVVNPKVVSCEYNLLTDGSMENLAEQINEIEDENERKKKLEQYDRLRKNLEKAKGIPEILQENLKEGGKYIVFIPVGGNEEGKDSIDKVKEWEKLISEYLKNSGIEPEYYSMLGTYSDRENERQLEGFESEKSDKTKFMIVMNKLNEGVHVDGVNGILWFRPLDENSKILYKQQIGRVITSVDPDNPPKDEEKPIKLDYTKNTEKQDKKIKKRTKKKNKKKKKKQKKKKK